jgi:Protein of unknown function (DUF4038)/Putative collagen-binding domain of a collagenase
MNSRKRHVVDASLTRRRFLTGPGKALAAVAMARLLPEKLMAAPAAPAGADGSKQKAGDGKVAFPLKVSGNRRYLVDSEGKPFFLLADTPWFLQKLPVEDVRRVMDDRLAKGFNTLFLEILDDSHLPSRDAYGHVAFDPELDITKPVEAYWRYADTVMDEAAKRGFFVIMSELWYGSGRGLWMHYVTPDSAQIYGHFIGRRYARFKNLMWMHCGDRNPDRRLSECANQLAEAIRKEAPHQLHTAHVRHEFASADFFGGQSWLDVDMAYTYAPSYIQVAKEYQRKNPVRPVILGETGYEGEPNAIELLPDAKKGDLWTPYRIRRNAYWAVFSGACGYCGGTRLWRWEKNWRDVLQVHSARQAPYLLRLMETIAWWRLKPDVQHQLVIAGFGTWKQADYLTAALADDGSAAVAYLPSARRITVNLAKLSGRATARWFDPASGQFTAVASSPFGNTGQKNFTPPGKNADGDTDWALVLEAGN